MESLEIYIAIPYDSVDVVVYDIYNGEMAGSEVSLGKDSLSGICDSSRISSEYGRKKATIAMEKMMTIFKLSK